MTGQLGVHREALRGWLRQAEADEGQRPGTSATEAQRIAELGREVRDLRRAHEILKTAALTPASHDGLVAGERGQQGVEGQVVDGAGGRRPGQVVDPRKLRAG